MENTICQFWPLITVIVFVLLIKVLVRRPSPDGLIYINPGQEVGDGCGALSMVLIISIIVGAAMFLLLLNT